MLVTTWQREGEFLDVTNMKSYKTIHLENHIEM